MNWGVPELLSPKIWGSPGCFEGPQGALGGVQRCWPLKFGVLGVFWGSSGCFGGSQFAFPKVWGSLNCWPLKFGGPWGVLGGPELLALKV